MQAIRFGIIGAGDWAIGRAQRFRKIEGCSVTVGWSRSESSCDRFFRETGAPTVEDWHEICDSDKVDAVVVATPNFLHFEQARAALVGGKHVLVETPLSLYHSEAQELANLAAQHSLVVHHGAKWRYHPDHAQEIESLRSAGPLVYAERTAAFDGGPMRPWYRDFTLSGGGFSFIPYVAVDFFQAFGEVQAVDGKHTRLHDLDIATMWVEFVDGGQGKITYGTGADIPDLDVGAVIGSDGIVQWGMGQPKTLVRGEDIVELPQRRDLDVVLYENYAFVDEIRGLRDFRPDLELDLKTLKAVSEAREQAK